MVHFVGAGPGAVDLITVRGAALLREADVILYAGSLVNPALLDGRKPECQVYNSAEMTLEEVLRVMEQAEAAGKTTVRLHSGDPSLYGAVREQMDALAAAGIPFQNTPGVSSFCGAAAALGVEYTLPGVSQSLIVTRLSGRTEVPEGESLASLAGHGASMVIFLSAGMLSRVQAELLSGGYGADTPAALVYKATWPEERVIRCTVGTLAEAGEQAGIRKTALILAGDFLGASCRRSRLYDPAFSTEFRRGREIEETPPGEAEGSPDRAASAPREKSAAPGDLPPGESLAFLSFTERGAALARRLSAALGGEASCTRENPALSLSSWTAANFPVRRGLVYVGAAGIAVRAAAPYLRSKTRDPAVVAVDEEGRFAVPLASGHWGGANDLARAIAALTGGTAVITTATDLRGLFAVDEWARRHNCAVIAPQGIKTLSGKLLAGETLTVSSAFPIDGAPPSQVRLLPNQGGAEIPADIAVDIRRREGFCLVPRVLVLGVGCKRGTSREAFEARFAELCASEALFPEAFSAAATIDRRAEEPGLLAFCAAHGWKLSAYSAAELGRVPGTFTASDFVASRLGVDNVCERAAAAGAGGGSEGLEIKKTAGAGVTMAAARRPVRLDWRWQDGDAVCDGHRAGE